LGKLFIAAILGVERMSCFVNKDLWGYHIGIVVRGLQLSLKVKVRVF